MRLKQRIRLLTRALLRRETVERELDDELKLHLDLETERHRRAGMSPEDARRAALLTFGGVDRVKEEVRDSWRVRFLETLVQDTRYGLRSLRRNPGFSLVVVVTLGLGIGANTAVFSVVRGVLLRPLPYTRGEEVVALHQSAPRAGVEDTGFSVKEVADYREMSRTLDDVVEYHSMSFTLLGGAEPQRVRTGVVSARFFDLLGVKPLLGRTFRDGEDALGAEPVLVLSHSFWQQKAGGDAGVVGRTFEMNDRVHTVVGVLPPLPGYPDENDVYMPASACPFRSRPSTMENREARMLNAFARLKPGVPLAQAQADLASIVVRLHAEYPDAYPKDADAKTIASPVHEEMVRQARPTFLVLLGTVALVLLIACANVANLSLARLSDRGRELAVRAALGAGRRRLVRQLLTESLILALAGGALGLLLAAFTLEALTGFAARFTPRAGEVHIDGAVLLFSLLVTALTGLLVGTLPGLPAFERLSRTLAGEGRMTPGRSRQRLRSALVVSQLALSFMLLIGAALMLRSFAKLQQVDAGFRSENVLTMRLDLNWSRYTTTERRTDAQRVLTVVEPLWDRLRAMPGVVTTGTAWTFPLNSTWRNDGTFQVEGRANDAKPLPRAEFLGASPDYFDAIGVPLLRGRAFDDHDRGEAEGVALVSKGLARRNWSDDDPVGQRISLDRGKTWRTVVGVVGDVRQTGLDREPKDSVYLPFLQFPGYSFTLFVRTLNDPRTMAEQVRAEVRSLDPEAAVSSVRTLEEIRNEALSSPRLTTVLLGLFAALALAISAAGLAGVIAYAVSQRTQEIGIRMALGAEPGRVLTMLLRQGMGSVVIGLGLGLLGALGLSRLISGLLFGVEPTDPLCFAGSAAVLLLVALAACFLPARRATGIDPMLALRAE
ncbi:MAG: ADOP family duplicated permease [Solirubrobacterales bacterium]|jgi:predicted permease